MNLTQKGSHSTPIIGVVADDITGANDIGIMFALSGYHTCVYPASQPEDYSKIAHGTPDVIIHNTNSRLDPPEVAYQKVFQATAALKAVGCNRFFNKTCSVFRGNIGIEFDAMLDALGLEFAIIVLGYPKNGRTTVNGIHYVHGKLLAESEFFHDPIHPMTQSNLVHILQFQTQRRVESLSSSIIDQGAAAVRETIAQKKRTCSYLIFDVRTENDLKIIAEAVRHETVLCGSSALAEYLAAAWEISGHAQGIPKFTTNAHLGVLCISGSLMPQTRAQIEFLSASGAVEFQLDGLSVQTDEGLNFAVQNWVPEIAATLQLGQNVIFHAGFQRDNVPANRTTDHARRISTALAEIGVQAMSAAGQNRLVVAGGETSDAVINRMGVQGLQIWKEIEPGLPSCVTLSDPPYLLILKSGSFGTPAFLANAVQQFRNIDPYP